ncbi:MAG: hypothetical protein ABSD42_08020 [Candidatus Bathyarchaeia archaeon]|jgi:hypothetical protein
MQQRQNDKKQDTPSERSLMRVLANSGHSEDIADKIWKWYNPPEINGSKPKKNSGI